MNEEIIIDGIKVNECLNFMPRYMEDYDIDTLNYCKCYCRPCKDVNDCLFKQLARKTVECEEHRSLAESYCNSYQSSCKVNGEITHRMFKYKEALDEIKNVWENDQDGDYDFVKFQILNIINKAKDGNGDKM